MANVTEQPIQKGVKSSGGLGLVGAIGVIAALVAVATPNTATAGSDAGLIVCMVAVVARDIAVGDKTVVEPSRLPVPTKAPEGDLRLSSLDRPQ